MAAPDWTALVDAVPWFARLSADARAWLMQRFEALRLRGGEVLFEAGSAPDALYVLVAGSLGAFEAGSRGRFLGPVVAGETAGETGLITGRPRGATVRALRDSEVLRLPRADFERLIEREPEALRAIARLALDRVAGGGRARAPAGPRTLAQLPQTPGLDAREAARHLAAALGRYGAVAVLDAASGGARDPAGLNQLEAAHRTVLYVADADDAEWRALCLRQADALLFLAAAGGEPAPATELLSGGASLLVRPEHLVLLHEGKPRLGAGRRWRLRRPGARLHHVRDASDWPRTARLATGRAVGLVLSGGGARGFAHIGVVRALREAGIVIDAVGGTSIGAIIGAGVAADWSVAEMTDVYRRSFVSTNPLSDRTIPFVSLVSGRKVSRLLREAYGEREIEDLPLPFFCVAADLTRGEAAVMRHGVLWRWLRASVAIPGVLPPVFHGGRVYVDGGVIDNLPVPTLRADGLSEVVAVDIGGDHAVMPGTGIDEFDLPPLWRMVAQWYTGRRRPSIVQIMLRAGMVNSAVATQAAREAASLLIMPPLAEIELLDWRRFDRAIDLGYQHALRVIGGSHDALAQEAPLFEP
ncbi:MAG: patatin-like phospholipase family protein [Pseudomonadota bacterium]